MTLYEEFFSVPRLDRTLPEESIDPRAALEIVQSEVLLDRNPDKNLATFVTTWMEPEARAVITENLHRNFIDHAEYPQTAEVARRCLRMLHSLFHGPGEPREPGAACAGSSEAVMLGALAMKWRWKNANPRLYRPNLVYGADAHVVWDKFCRYFDVEPRQVPLASGRTTVGPDELAPHIDERTIGVVAVLGTTFTGECDDVAGIDALLRSLHSERGLDVPLHVDAASGGMVFPFSHPELEWDFRLEHVRSINVSGHKFGLVYPGIGWLVFRDERQLPDELVFYEDYLGERDATFTLNFSGSSSFILAQYYNFIRFGRAGYTSLVRTMRANADALLHHVRAQDGLELVGGQPQLPLAISRVSDGESFTGAELVGELAKRRGWVLPAYHLPPANQDVEIMRALVKITQSRELVDALAADIHDSVAALRNRAAGVRVSEPVNRGHAY